jgi:hypothetical protein
MERGGERAERKDRQNRNLIRLSSVLVSLSSLLSACSGRAPQSASVVAPIAAPPADGALHVALAWTVPVDLDLYVSDPAGETLYFANNPTRAGARLEQDARCGARAGTTIERMRFPLPAPGRYRVGVDFIDACGAGSSSAVPFRVAVDHGAARAEAAGTALPGEFKVIVLEFDVTEDGLGGAVPSAPRR